MPQRAKSAVVGVGISGVGEVLGRAVVRPALAAIDRALEDCGLRKEQLDGLLMQSGTSAPGIGLGLQNAGGFKHLRLLNHMDAGGATPISMVQFATMAIQAGMASAVVCVFADAPLGGRPSEHDAGAAEAPSGFASLDLYYGPMDANAEYAMAARRHMALYGTSSEQLGAIAVSTRAWACLNPLAQMRTPMTLEDHQRSPWVVEPLRQLDYCLISDGAAAVVVTGIERARDLKSKPAYVLAMAQGHPGNRRRAGETHDYMTGAAIARDTLFGQMGITAQEIDVCELDDITTYTTLVTLEDYGFCEKGEGGPFVADCKLGPGGSLPTNTGGGRLSAFGLSGMTALAEAVVQARGGGGERQVEKHSLVLVTGDGGVLDYHASLVLSPDPS